MGGLGAGILWTCQGAFFSEVCARVAAAEGDDMPKAVWRGDCGLLDPKQHAKEMTVDDVQILPLILGSGDAPEFQISIDFCVFTSFFSAFAHSSCSFLPLAAKLLPCVCICFYTSILRCILHLFRRTQLVVSKSLLPPAPQVTAELAGSFALVFLAMEALARDGWSSYMCEGGLKDAAPMKFYVSTHLC